MRAAILADGRAWKNWVTGSSFTRRGLVSRTATRIYHAENLRRLSKIAFRRAKNLEREEVEEGGALERVQRREDTVENWGQDENWRAKHDESENSWAKQFPRRVDGIEGIKKIGLVDFRPVFSLGVCV